MRPRNAGTGKWATQAPWKLRLPKAVFWLALALCGVSAAPAGAVDARYSELDLDACETLESFEEGVGAALRCDGLDGVPIFVTEGDLRFDVDFGVPDEHVDTFMPFNSVGTTVEWRVEDGVPFAAILRFTLENIEDPLTGSRGSVLAVHKVGREEAAGCPLAYVDAVLNPEANVLAAQVADGFARAFRCGVDRATYIGRTGPLSGEATATQAP